MEDWQRDFEWLRVRHFVKAKIGREDLPDLNAVLFLIGIRELGQVPKTKFTKEEKQDLMHIGICSILMPDGYYQFTGKDHDGWPHFELLKTIPNKTVKEQEQFLIDKIIYYFKDVIVDWEMNKSSSIFNTSEEE